MTVEKDKTVKNPDKIVLTSSNTEKYASTVELYEYVLDELSNHPKLSLSIYTTNDSKIHWVLQTSEERTLSIVANAYVNELQYLITIDDFIIWGNKNLDQHYKIRKSKRNNRKATE